MITARKSLYILEALGLTPAAAPSASLFVGCNMWSLKSTSINTANLAVLLQENVINLVVDNDS